MPTRPTRSRIQSLVTSPAGGSIPIEIDNRNIYELDDPRYSGFFFTTANRLHIVTRSQIVRQELLFHVGEPYDPELTAETARNLRTRFPFNDAWIDLVEYQPGKLLVRVVTIDQWSLIGGVRSIDRNGQETDFRFGFEERNFLGRAQFMSLDWFVRELHPDYVNAVYREPRITGRPWSVELSYSSNPENELKEITLAHPYYSLAQSQGLPSRPEPGHPASSTGRARGNRWRNG
jgi:hypothetical protein